MSILSKATVKGFWGDHDFELPFDEELNFIIGPNGTGKTTFVNMIASALTGDLSTLAMLPFAELALEIKGRGSARPTLTFQRVADDETVPSIRIFAQAKKSEKPSEIKLPYEFRRLLRGPGSRHYPKSGFSQYLQEHLRDQLDAFIETTWVSVHRAPPANPREDGGQKNAIDRRLYRLQNQLVRKISQMSTARDGQIKEFQQTVLLSLLNKPDFSKHKIDSVEDHVINQEQQLINALNELQVPESKYKRSLAQFSRNAIPSYEKYHKGDPLSIDDLYYALNLSRIDEVVDNWIDLQSELNSIMMEKNRLLEVINELFNRKSAYITESNELFFESRSGKTLSIYDLSSGEKQLLIMIVETMLQNREPHTFIADEPEISLHVDWQEKLVSSIKKLNPSAQIIFATHSPDVVAGNTKNIVKMEDLIP
jgi:predicted ATP-dependent endonuclease of OLD family